MTSLDPEATARAIEELRAAFPDRPFPRGMATSTGGRWFDEGGSLHTYRDPEADEVARFFGGRTWPQIEPDDLLRWDHSSVSMIFLGPAARAYYAPAFLNAFLAAPLDGTGIAVLESVIRCWTPPGVPPSGPPRESRPAEQRSAMETHLATAFQQFVDSLTEAQRAAIATSLKVFEPAFEEPGLENPVKTALERFWGRYQK